MVNSIQKGKSGEREAGKAIEEALELFPGSIRRSQQYSGKGDSSADLIGLPGVHLEIKRTEKFKLYPSLDQAHRDAKNGNVPIVVHRQNKKDWVVVIKLEELPRLVTALNSIRNPNHGTRIKRTLRNPAQPT
jgi:hypothetical protein